MKIAIVRFKTRDEATRAVDEGEVNIEFGAVSIERALQRAQRDRRDNFDRNDRNDRDGDKKKKRFF